MPYYSFHQSSVVTTTEEHYFRVRADTYAQAVERIRGFTDQDVDNHLHEDDLISEQYATCNESSVKLPVEQNHGQPTIRIYNDRNELITHNQIMP